SRERERDDWTRRREAARGDPVMRPGRGGPFAAVVEKLVRGCGAQGAEFENWPFDAIAQIVGADEKERNALAALRESAKAAAQDDRREAREHGSRRDRWRAYAAAREAPARATAPRQAAAPGWSATCEELAAVLRNWPVREIERDVRLSSTQRVAFYELVTASLK